MVLSLLIVDRCFSEARSEDLFQNGYFLIKKKIMKNSFLNVNLYVSYNSECNS